MMVKPVRILIVEDERLTAKSLKFDLQDFGYDVLDTVERGENAILIALQEMPALILMDIRLAGGLDGIEAAEEIYKKKQIPIIFMTGYATNFIQERAQKVNPLAFLEKPVDLARIKMLIDTHIQT